MDNKLRCAIVFLAVLFLPLLQAPIEISSPISIDSFDDPELLPESIEPIPDDYFTVSHEESLSGVLDALPVEQQGYTSSGNLSARTDTGLNTATSLSIDEDHDWVGSSAEVDVWDLSEIYAVNGTFDSGYSGTNEFPNGSVQYYPLGWVSNSTHSEESFDDSVQSSSYVDSGSKYVIVENEGAFSVPAHADDYTHYAGTSIVWSQSINKQSSFQDFILSFDYLYFRGPLGTGYSGNCSIAIYANEIQVWNQSLLTLQDRGVWYENLDIELSVMGGATSFNLSIGLSIDSDLFLDPDTDGITDTAWITVFFDNVLLVGATPPDFSNIELQFTAGGTTEPILGSGSEGSASILNSSYWDADPLSISISSNSSVSFKYNARLQTHRFTNTSWTTEIAKEGAQYSVNLGESAFIEMYTYSGFLADYENLTMLISFPSDWANITVYDPQMADVTSQCIFQNNVLEIGEDLLSMLGWWKVTLDSPNYAKSIDVQKYHVSSDEWISDSIYRSGNISRAAISIGTLTTTPSTINSVNVTLRYPNGTIWSQESLSGGIDGSLNSSQRTFASTNTTAGEWCFRVQWINGTEIAYDHFDFEIHHRTRLVPVPELIETDSGNIITGLVQFVDDETEEFLMDASSNIVGNWSGSSVPFSANLPENKWQANFDTSLVGIGEFVILVNASRPYFDNSFGMIVVKITAANTQLSLDQDSLEIDIGENITVNLFFEDEFASGIEDASINVSVSGPSEDISWEWSELTSGNYSATLSVYFSGTYAITFSASKSYHEMADDTLFLLVGDIGTNLDLLNNTVDVINFGDSYRLAVHFENSTRYSLEGATVRIADVSPENGLGLENYTFFDETDGYYSIVLSPEATGTYIILIQANLTNHRTQFLTFTLTTTEISTVLTLELSSEVINLNQNCTVSLLFVDDDTLTGLGGATLAWVNPESGIQIVDIIEFGDGYYNLTVVPSEFGSFQVFIRAYLANHINATAGFTLTVTLVPTLLHFEDNIQSVLVEVSESFELVVQYQEVDVYGLVLLNITQADIDITFISGDSEALIVSISEVGTFYLIVFKAYQTGTWDLYVSASKDNYAISSKAFTITVSNIDTEVNDILLDHVHVGTSYVLDYHFTFAGNGIGIEGATITPQGDRIDWITWIESGEGSYTVTLIPLRLGNNYSIALLFSLDGYETRTATLAFNVVEIEVDILVSTLSWREGTPLEIAIELVEHESRESVEGALVTYSLLSGTDIITTGEFLEINTGNYSATIGADLWTQSNDLSLLITFDREYYFAEDVDVQIIVQEDAQARLTAFVTQNILPVLGIAMLFIVGIVSQRVYAKRNRARFIEAQAIKLRFDDANNLLGVIVLHKSSGLPVYSRILKGGFEEGMISAFITAISHFRSEFDENGTEDLGKIIPISDIIRTVATKNLLCAFISVTNPSPTSEKKMVEFSVSTRMLFDDTYDVAPTEYRNKHVDQSFNRLFERHLDSALLQEYKICDDIDIPKEFRQVAEIIDDIALKGTFKLTTLALAIAMMGGIHEAFAYQKVSQAQATNIIVPIKTDCFLISESETFPWKKEAPDSPSEE